MAELLKPAVLEDGTVVPYGFGWRVDKDESRRDLLRPLGQLAGVLRLLSPLPEGRPGGDVLSNSADTDTEYLAATAAEMFR